MLRLGILLYHTVMSFKITHFYVDMFRVYRCQAQCGRVVADCLGTTREEALERALVELFRPF